MKSPSSASTPGCSAPGRAWLRACLLSLIALACLPSAVLAQRVAVRQETLSNGMRILLLERPDDPSISGGWVAHVGSANERPGITGIAHLFEHMMFKGTPTIGTRDARKDLEIIAEQERVRDLMRAEESLMRARLRRGEIDDITRPENQSPRMKELAAEFKTLIDRQREVLVKNEFDRIYQAAGASGMNAFTSHDLTGYFITVPANKLELWMWMESERLWRPVFREFYAERDVVFEERRMRTESTPLGKFRETLMGMFWESSPYHWPVIGWPSDIPAISKAQADEFYGLYYAPQNITLILVGAFKSDDALVQAERYFGRIPRGTRPPPEVVTLENLQVAEKRMIAEAEANPQVEMLWHAVPFGHKDSYTLDVLAQILSTPTGRLHKGLVLGSKIATRTSAEQENLKYGGVFTLSGEAAEGHTPEEVESALEAELDRLRNEPVPAEELQKVKNQFAAEEYRKLSSNFMILVQLIYNEGLGDWREINERGPKMQAVTAAEIQAAAKRYFNREQRTVAIYRRKPGSESAGGDADLAALPPDQKSRLEQVRSALRAETDTAKLTQALAGVRAQASQADSKFKPFLAAYEKVLTRRLAELQKK